jgi:sporulation protein YlmC with PRC-barrel domain
MSKMILALPALIESGVSMIDASKLDGVRVITKDSYALGEIEGIVVDTKNWMVTHQSVKLTDESTRELGFKKPLLGSVKICIPVEHVGGYGDVVTLNKSLLELKNLPECKARD